MFRADVTPSERGNRLKQVKAALCIAQRVLGPLGNCNHCEGLRHVYGYWALRS